jgi:hypothetical protein
MRKLPIITLLLAVTFPLFARDITVIVRDIDLNLPLEGAVIHSWDGNEYICDEDGKAVIQAPDNTQVTIYATYPGYGTGRILIPVFGETFTINLELSSVMQGRELVIEGTRPGAGESRTGRSIAVGEKEISQSGEIGIMEDVMSTIKLLPGVNYSNFFDAMPSIRGGFPGDMIASLNGFYINNPFHWGGGFSIFDPRTVQNALLSHGVFSSRYGNTISGLLEITLKKPSPTEIEFDFGANVSAANLYLSFPFSGKGGILFVGRVTYYDPLIALAKLISKKVPQIEMINSINTAPYIRAGTINSNYRFTDKLELEATAFWGMDGVGVLYNNFNRRDDLDSDSDIKFDFANYQGFLTGALSWNPRADMLLKFSAGTGYEDVNVDGKMTYNIHNKEFSENFMEKYRFLFLANYIKEDNYQYFEEGFINQSDFTYNAQGRIDFDWELSKNLIVAAGFQEMFNWHKSSGEQQQLYDIWFNSKSLDAEIKEAIISAFPYLAAFSDILIVGLPVPYTSETKNRLLTTSSYILGEYGMLNNRLQAELGFRIDHFILLGNGFTLNSAPAFNPRINVDFNVFKNKYFIKSFDLSVGSGLFSSVNKDVFIAEEKHNIDIMKPNRSLTSILGMKLEFPREISFTIEGYNKYVFNRMYIPINFSNELDVNPRFDGIGRVWGVDIMLQRKESAFIDGWLAYSWNWAKYRDPSGGSGMGRSGGNRGDDWYFPSYHRFHNLNLIVNIKPVQKINIFVSFGFASGVQLSRRVGDGPESYPVLIYDNNNPRDSYFIEKYRWESVRDENNRTTPSLPLDVKLTIFGNTKKNKKYEVYIAVENCLALLYTAQGNTRFNQYTGQIDTGSNSASYDIPIPRPSFGFKMRY